jgi:biopolymer transport protein ExbB
MNASYGLVNVWTQGDGVTRTVLLILLTMSLASWLVILFRLLDLRRLSAQSGTTEAFWHAKDLAAGL